MPRFTVVIPCFNAAATIEATLGALAAQTCPDWEAIVVDDGSSDDSLSRVRACAAADPRIHAVTNPGKGPSAARNHGGLEQARGEIVAFCDADDIWVSTKLAELAAVFADPKVDGAYGRIGFFRDRPSDAQVFSSVPERPLGIQMLLGENPVCTMSNIAVRRAALAATGGFDTDMVHNEDLDWLIRLVGHGAHVIGLPMTQVWYRTSTGGLSADLAAMSAGRQRALESARRFGVVPSRAAEAIHFRYLARRALRLDAPRGTALGLCLRGVAQDPRGFLTPVRRGVPTALAALVAPVLPRDLRQSLFAR